MKQIYININNYERYGFWFKENHRRKNVIVLSREYFDRNWDYNKYQTEYDSEYDGAWRPKERFEIPIEEFKFLKRIINKIGKLILLK
jgi:hypothetical protein